MYADSVVDLFRSEIHFENAFATFRKNAEKIAEKKPRFREMPKAEHSINDFRIAISRENFLAVANFRPGRRKPGKLIARVDGRDTTTCRVET